MDKASTHHLLSVQSRATRALSGFFKAAIAVVVMANCLPAVAIPHHPAPPGEFPDIKFATGAKYKPLTHGTPEDPGTYEEVEDSIKVIAIKDPALAAKLQAKLEAGLIVDLEGAEHLGESDGPFSGGSETGAIGLDLPGATWLETIHVLIHEQAHDDLPYDKGPKGVKPGGGWGTPRAKNVGYMQHHANVIYTEEVDWLCEEAAQQTTFVVPCEVISKVIDKALLGELSWARSIAAYGRDHPSSIDPPPAGQSWQDVIDEIAQQEAAWRAKKRCVDAEATCDDCPCKDDESGWWFW